MNEYSEPGDHWIPAPKTKVPTKGTSVPGKEPAFRGILMTIAQLSKEILMPEVSGQATDM